VIVVSIDSGEGPELARTKKANTMKRLGRDEAAAGWHFLTGPESSIKALADAVGFRYSRTGTGNSIAHPAGIVVLTPQGRISRAFYGVEYAPRDVRLGLIDAAEAKIGTLTERVMLYLCWEYDPTTGKYGVAIMSALRIGGGLTLLGLGAMIAVFARRERRRTRGLEGGRP
jgi:protein SCO1/2